MLKASLVNTIIQNHRQVACFPSKSNTTVSILNKTSSENTMLEGYWKVPNKNKNSVLLNHEEPFKVLCITNILQLGTLFSNTNIK